MAQRFIADAGTDIGDLLWCENVWCGLEYVVVEGWGGLCPSCVTLVDEHLASGHGHEVAACVECQRSTAPRTRRQVA
jgi:NMD protein affecting ribosome stability and mRNA decay